METGLLGAAPAAGFCLVTVVRISYTDGQTALLGSFVGTAGKLSEISALKSTGQKKVDEICRASKGSRSVGANAGLWMGELTGAED